MLGKFLKSMGINSFAKQKSQFDELLLSIEQYVLSTEKYIYAGQELSFANSSDYQQLKKLNSADKLEVLHVLVQKISTVEFYDDLGFKSYLVDIHLLSKLLRFRLQFPSGYSFLGLFNQLYQPNKCYELELTIPDRPFGHFVKQIESHVGQHGLDPTTSADIKALISHPKLSQYTTQGAGKEYWGPDIGKAVNKLETLLFLHDKQLTPPYVLDGGALASILNKSLAELSFQEQNQWHVIFNHLSTASASKPNKSFMQSAELIIAQIGNDRYQAQVLEWITAIAKLKVPVEAGSEFIEQQHVDLLKGMLWTLSLYQDPKTLQAVDELVAVCFKKIIGKGAAAPSVGNAGIYVLAQADGVTGINHLSKLKLKIRQNNTQKLIQKYIEKKATSLGMSTAQIEELSVPSFGLVNGKLSIDFAQYQFNIVISDLGKLETHWLAADGSKQKATPERVKNNDIFIEKLKDVRALCKQIKQALSVQKNRLDRLYSENMQWTLSSFSKIYLQHGLLSQIANKLIWAIEDNPVMCVANTWQDAQGQIVEFSQDAKVQLWHPLYSDNSVVIAWQKKLQKMQIQQPFKQVYREVYHVTEPDISGQLSSSRLATHILRQHQLQSLAIAKGWSFRLLTAMGDRTGRGEVTKTFAEYNLTVKFFVNEPTTSGVDINESWIWQYVVTDDIQFFNENTECVNLKTVPAILISEVFRDMNLFVDVASIASEPLWVDDKAEKLQGYKDYWQVYSFGKLTDMAKSRKTMLENLLPHLTLSSHFAIDGNFLVIQGKMHSYKIHIGSAQILNNANDQVLYFEPGKIALKFKDNTDSLLDLDSVSLAILSKAHALVDDDKIEYPSFLSQLSNS